MLTSKEPADSCKPADKEETTKSCHLDMEIKQELANLSDYGGDTEEENSTGSFDNEIKNVLISHIDEFKKSDEGLDASKQSPSDSCQNEDIVERATNEINYKALELLKKCALGKSNHEKVDKGVARDSVPTSSKSMQESTRLVNTDESSCQQALIRVLAKPDEVIHVQSTRTDISTHSDIDKFRENLKFILSKRFEEKETYDKSVSRSMNESLNEVMKLRRIEIEKSRLRTGRTGMPLKVKKHNIVGERPLNHTRLSESKSVHDELYESILRTTNFDVNDDDLVEESNSLSSVYPKYGKSDKAKVPDYNFDVDVCGNDKNSADCDFEMNSVVDGNSDVDVMELSPDRPLPAAHPNKLEPPSELPYYRLYPNRLMVHVTGKLLYFDHNYLPMLQNETKPTQKAAKCVMKKARSILNKKKEKKWNPANIKKLKLGIRKPAMQRNSPKSVSEKLKMLQEYVRGTKYSHKRRRRKSKKKLPTRPMTYDDLGEGRCNTFHNTQERHRRTELRWLYERLNYQLHEHKKSKIEILCEAKSYIVELDGYNDDLVAEKVKLMKEKTKLEKKLKQYEETVRMNKKQGKR